MSAYELKIQPIGLPGRRTAMMTPTTVVANSAPSRKMSPAEMERSAPEAPPSVPPPSASPAVAKATVARASAIAAAGRRSRSMLVPARSVRDRAPHKPYEHSYRLRDAQWLGHAAAAPRSPA